MANKCYQNVFKNCYGRARFPANVWDRSVCISLVYEIQPIHDDIHVYVVKEELQLTQW